MMAFKDLHICVCAFFVNFRQILDHFTAIVSFARDVCSCSGFQACKIALLSSIIKMLFVKLFHYISDSIKVFVS